MLKNKILNIIKKWIIQILNTPETVKEPLSEDIIKTVPNEDIRILSEVNKAINKIIENDLNISKCNDLNSTEKLLLIVITKLLYLSMIKDNNDLMEISYKKLSEITNINRNTLKTNMKLLREKNYISTTPTKEGLKIELLNKTCFTNIIN